MRELLKEEQARREATRELIRRGDFLLFQKHIFATVYNKPFKHSWYHELIAQILTNVINGTEKRVIISLPPRYFKTEQTVRMFIPFAHGMHPKWKFQYITYGSELTEDTSTDVKTNMYSSEYKKIFPHVKFNDMQSKKSNWKLETLGEFFGTSIGGVITGKGSHVTVIDDPMKAMDADSKAERDAVMKFYRGSVITRLEDDGAIVIIMQRLHEDDLVGQLIKEQGLKEDGGVWTYVSLPILNEEREVVKYGDFEYIREANEPLNPLIHNHEQIAQLEKEMGKKEFRKQYMQDPENKESGHFKKEDIIIGGSPCQDFSIAGLRAGVDGHRGQLIWQYFRIINEVKPPIFIYENVKGMVSDRGGKTLSDFLEIFRSIGYSCHSEVLNTLAYGVPQNRERIYIVGFLNTDDYFRFNFAPKIKLEKRIRDILEDEVDEKYFLTHRFLAGATTHKERHGERGNGFKFEPVSPNGFANTVVTGYGHRYTDTYIKVEQVGTLDIKGNDSIKRVYSPNGCAPSHGNEPKVVFPHNYRVRKLTPRECFRLQDFPDDFKFVVSNTQLYKQAGNAMSVNVIEMILRQIEEAKNNTNKGGLFC